LSTQEGTTQFKKHTYKVQVAVVALWVGLGGALILFIYLKVQKNI